MVLWKGPFAGTSRAVMASCSQHSSLISFPQRLSTFHMSGLERCRVVVNNLCGISWEMLSFCTACACCFPFAKGMHIGSMLLLINCWQKQAPC